LRSRNTPDVAGAEDAGDGIAPLVTGRNDAANAGCGGVLKTRLIVGPTRNKAATKPMVHAGGPMSRVGRMAAIAPAIGAGRHGPVGGSWLG
jgi:hypothetical protein